MLSKSSKCWVLLIITNCQTKKEIFVLAKSKFVFLNRDIKISLVNALVVE